MTAFRGWLRLCGALLGWAVVLPRLLKGESGSAFPPLVGLVRRSGLFWCGVCSWGQFGGGRLGMGYYWCRDDAQGWAWCFWCFVLCDGA